MRQSLGLFGPSGAFFRLQFSAGYTINMFGFDFRHGQDTDEIDGTCREADIVYTQEDNVKPFVRASMSEGTRVVQQFEEINTFIDRHRFVPCEGPEGHKASITERQLRCG